MTASFTVYWQPGCSSCLQAKEFLTSHGVDFVSVNVREDESAMETLEALGARSIPVVSRGQDFVFAQDINTLASFVGIDLNRVMLSPDILVERIDTFLAAAQRYTAQLPAEILTTKLPGRDRSYFDLAYHIFMIPLAFLDAARGGELSFEHFERSPPTNMSTVEQLVGFGEEIRQDMKSWWKSLTDGNLPETVATYYGRHSGHSVLERTAWHVAQHTRQLMTLVINQGVSPNGPLLEADLAGLPLPKEIYDDEVHLPSP